MQHMFANQQRLYEFIFCLFHNYNLLFYSYVSFI